MRPLPALRLPLPASRPRRALALVFAHNADAFFASGRRADESRRRTCAPATAVYALMQCFEVAAWAGWDRRGGDSALCRSHAGAAPGATAAAVAAAETVVARVRLRLECAYFREVGFTKQVIHASGVRLLVLDLKEYIRDMASLKYTFRIYSWVTSSSSLNRF